MEENDGMEVAPVRAGSAGVSGEIPEETGGTGKETGVGSDPAKSSGGARKTTKESGVAKRKYRCKQCGGEGHQARACPRETSRTAPEGSSRQDAKEAEASVDLRETEHIGKTPADAPDPETIKAQREMLDEMVGMLLGEWSDWLETASKQLQLEKTLAPSKRLSDVTSKAVALAIQQNIPDIMVGKIFSIVVAAGCLLLSHAIPSIRLILIAKEKKKLATSTVPARP